MFPNVLHDLFAINTVNPNRRWTMHGVLNSYCADSCLFQEHMVDNTDVLPRQGFSQMARNMRCQLYFPHPTDQVILLRTGVLHHINSYMQALGLAPPSAPQQPPASSLPDQADANGPRAASNGPGAALNGLGASAKGPMAAAGDAMTADTVALPANSDALGAAQRNLTDAPHGVTDGSQHLNGNAMIQNITDEVPTAGTEAAAEESQNATEVLIMCCFWTVSSNFGQK